MEFLYFSACWLGTEILTPSSFQFAHHGNIIRNGQRKLYFFLSTCVCEWVLVGCLLVGKTKSVNHSVDDIQNASRSSYLHSIEWVLKTDHWRMLVHCIEFGGKYFRQKKNSWILRIKKQAAANTHNYATQIARPAIYYMCRFFYFWLLLILFSR